MINSKEFQDRRIATPRETLYRNAGRVSGRSDPAPPGAETMAALAVRLVCEQEAGADWVSLPPLPLQDPELYRLWLTQQPRPSDAQRALMAQASHLPMLSFAMHVDAAHDRCEAAIASVCAQIYPRLELLLIGRLASMMAGRVADPRIRAVDASPLDRHAIWFNQAIKAASGSHLASIGSQDLLAETASFEIAAAAAEADIITTDSDELNSVGARCEPQFRTAWDDDTALAGPGPGLVAISVDVLRKIGGMGVGLASAGGWDMLLRASVHVPPQRIRQVPGVHISRRTHAVHGPSRKLTSRIVKNHLRMTQRANCTVHVRRRWPVRVVYPLPASPPLVSVIVATPRRCGTAAHMSAWCAEPNLLPKRRDHPCSTTDQRSPMRSRSSHGGRRTRGSASAATTRRSTGLR